MRATSAIVMIAILATAGCEKKQRFVQKPESMSPTIQPEEVVVADMQAYNRAEPQRWDAVVMKAPPPYEDLWIKRVVGLPGEVIDFVCDCGESDSGDEFVWIPRIEYTSVNRSSGGGGIKMVWGAKADFDRRFDQIPRRMTRWEQYAQVLLQANELHFID